MYKQDLHIHTVFSKRDRAIVPQQTLELISWTKHAKIVGISDHFEYLRGKTFEIYKSSVSRFGFYCGTEVDGHKEAERAVDYEFDYFVYHCFDRTKDYKGAEKLLSTGKPVIIAHPNALGTDLNKVPSDCLVEINNRYVWRSDWQESIGPFARKFKFVFSSDAHQPNWLNQEISIRVADDLGIAETILFA